MKPRVLVTGISGFTGPYVRAALERRGYDVYGLSSHSENATNHEVVNVLDVAAIDGWLRRTPVDYIIHLAGVSFVAHERTADQYLVNLIGSLHLLEAVRRAAVPVNKLILASSANVYGRPARIPVDETAIPAPISDYGVSKYAMELMAQTWFDRLPILIVRPFNYTGVGQKPTFILPKLVESFRQGAETLELGDTSVVREFMDVRDVAEVYVRLLESDAKSDVVNICSGIGHRVDSIIETLHRLSGHAPRIRSSAALLRRNEIHELVGSPDKLGVLTGGLSFKPLEETLAWMLAP